MKERTVPGLHEQLGIVIHGASGRMGRNLINVIAGSDDLVLRGALVRPGSSHVGCDAGEAASAGSLGVTFSSDVNNLPGPCDVVIDFSCPAATLELVAAVSTAGRPLVIGTTGFSSTEVAQLRRFSQHIPIVLAANMSVGIGVTLQLLDVATRALGQQADIDILEAHHRNKVDAPSGTALLLGQCIAQALGKKLSDCTVDPRAGHSGPRQPGSIGFESIRAGDIVGEHSILFALPGERLEITHRASSRDNFSSGALRAARWLVGRAAGLYDMKDVLEFV